MSVRAWAAFWIALAIALPGCSTAPRLPDVPALRTTADAASQKEIEQVLSAALNGVPITISADALTESSVLIIERATHRRIGRAPEPGRATELPERFQLVIDGRQCFLVHDRTGLRWLLADTSCDAE